MGDRTGVSRRELLGLATTTAVPAIAGCGAPASESTPSSAGAGRIVDRDVVESDRIHYLELNLGAHEWLTESTVGGPAPNYDGTFADERWRETVRVTVGAGASATVFEPAAVVVSPGTTVVWEWTGDGGAHSVVADGDAQIGETAYEFDSGQPVDQAGTTFEVTVDEPGNALYHCETHLGEGVKGVVAVW